MVSRHRIAKRSESASGAFTTKKSLRTVPPVSTIAVGGVSLLPYIATG